MSAGPQTGACAAGEDYHGRSVLVTGGTRGIGLAIGQAFAGHGADVTLTHKWGSVDEAEILRAFAAAGMASPHIFCADAASEEDARKVLSAIRGRGGQLDAFVSNVAFAPVVRSLDEYTRRGLVSAIDYSVWPIVTYLRVAHEVFGRYPRYVVALSSEGADSYHVNYDIIAAAKAALESLCRYLHHRLRAHGTSINVVRTRFVSTDSLRATFGDGFEAFVEARSPGAFTPAADVAQAVFGLCSGLMDSCGGQVVSVDGGASIFENFSGLYEQSRERA